MSKQNLFIGGGAELDWNTSELLFGRLAAQRLTEAAQANARAVTSNVQLDVALAYLDLVRVYGEIAIFADALARAEEMLRNAESAEKAGLSKTTADINRARTEVDLRRERAVPIAGRDRHRVGPLGSPVALASHGRAQADRRADRAARV